MPQSRHRKTAKAKKRPKGTYAASGPRPHTGKNRNLRIGASILVAALAVSAIAYIIMYRGSSGTEIVTASGLKYVDIVQGNGPNPRLGQTVVVNYIGTLENGTKFDSSRDGQPTEFRLARGSLIEGANEIAVRTVANRFQPSGVWVVTTNAAIRSKPNYFFAILEDGINVIRTQAAAGSIKSQALHFLVVGEKENTIAVSSYPNVVSDAVDGGNCAR